MTRLSKYSITCPNCHKSFSIVTEASINTWMDPELVDKFLNDKYYYICPHCQQSIHFIHKMIINGPKGMFSMDNNESYESKKAKLIEYGVFDAENKVKSMDSLFQRFENKETEHLHGRDQKKNRGHLKTMIINFFSVIRSKQNNELKFDFFDWDEYDKITLNIIEELERERENYYLHPPGYKLMPLEKDESLMEKWRKIKEIMDHEQRPILKHKGAYPYLKKILEKREFKDSNPNTL